MSIEEVQHLANTQLWGKLGAEIRRAFLFACYTGLRVSDIKSIKCGNIEHNPLQIIKRQEKTQQTVCIPLKEIAWEMINDFTVHHPNDNIFSLLSKTQSQTNKYLIRLALNAGISKPVGWHTARRTFATLALENGVDIYTVAKLLGHKNIKQVAKYAQATDKLRRKAIDALPEIVL